MSSSDSSELVEKGLPCEDCGSSDALASYSDGHTYCFSCGTHTPGKGSSSSKKAPKKKTSFDYSSIKEVSEPKRLDKWKITAETCKHWDYRVEARGGKGYHYATYKDEEGLPVFCKVRVVTPSNDKESFFGIGDQDAVSLYGIERAGSGGKMIVVAEGEKDTLACSQLWGNKFPVVGLPFGAESSGKAFAKALPKLNQYDKVVLALDMDEAGRTGSLELAKMLPPGKAYIAEMSHKDIHENVQKAGSEATTRALFNAPAYRPDGIVEASSLWGLALSPTVTGFSFPYKFMTDWTYGLRPGDVVVIGAGTGIGKSDLQAEFVAHDIRPKADGGEELRVAVFNYEASPVRTLKGIAGKLWSKRFHVPMDDKGAELWTHEELIEAKDYMDNLCGRLFINDHYGAVDWPSVKERLRYLRHAERIDKAYVDPVAALVAQEDDDRKALDKLFAEAKSLAEELGIPIIFNSHLTRPGQGDSHEEGGRVELKHFRGSGAIVMWASFVFGMERDQQAEDEQERATTTIRVLKDRFTGDSTGETKQVVYNQLTGRLEVPAIELDEVAPPPVEDKDDN